MRRFGPDSVWLEFHDHRITIVPRSWTSLVPRASPLVMGERPVRLAPRVAHELALWVAAQRPVDQKLDTTIQGDQTLAYGRRQRRSDGDEPAASVVEQARTPNRRSTTGRTKGRR
jgi:hypothetical protein